MKTSLKILVLLIAVSTPLLLLPQVSPSKAKNGQLNPVGSSVMTSSSNSSNGASFFYDNDNKNLGDECALYLAAWQPGILVLKDNTEILGRQYRFNLYTRQMEFTDGIDTAAIGNPEDIDRLTMDDRHFVFKKIEQAENSGTYLELVVDGKYQLYCCRYIKYKYITGENDLTTGKPEEKYYMETTLFYSVDHSDLHKMPEKRQEVIHLFDDFAPELKPFMISRKNKLRTKADFIEMFNYLNDQ